MTRLILFAALLAGCSTINSQAEISTGECKGSALKAMDTGDTGFDADPHVEADVSGADIVLHLIDVNANCCPSPDADISVGEGTITVDFEDVTGDDACLCMCFIDFDVTVEDPGAGSWTVQVNHNGSSFGSVEVEL